MSSKNKLSPLIDTMNNIKEFFTDSEWDLIYNLVANNREFCEDDEYDPRSDYDNIVDKISNLFEENK
jgi:hypothetical protein